MLPGLQAAWTMAPYVRCIWSYMRLPDCLAQCFCMFSRIEGFNTESSSCGKVMVACVRVAGGEEQEESRGGDVGPSLARSECHDQMNHPHGAWLAYTPHQSTPVPPCLTHVGFMLCLVPTLLRPHGLQPTRLLFPWDSPGKNPGLGCHALLQRIFWTQKSNQDLLHCTWILYQHLGLKNSPFYRQRGGVRGEHMESFCVLRQIWFLRLKSLSLQQYNFFS